MTCENCKHNIGFFSHVPIDKTIGLYACRNQIDFKNDNYNTDNIAANNLPISIKTENIDEPSGTNDDSLLFSNK